MPGLSSARSKGSGHAAPVAKRRCILLEAVAVAAMVDRLVHRAQVIVLKATATGC